MKFVRFCLGIARSAVRIDSQDEGCPILRKSEGWESNNLSFRNIHKNLLQCPL
jgi:hypothetical protein